jgi:hypothetical protein
MWILISGGNTPPPSSGLKYTDPGIGSVIYVLHARILWHVDPLLGNGSEISSYKTAIAPMGTNQAYQSVLCLILFRKGLVSVAEVSPLLYNNIKCFGPFRAV